MRFYIFAVITLLLLFFCNKLNASQITVLTTSEQILPGRNNVKTIFIDGIIEKGDFEKLSVILEQIDPDAYIYQESVSRGEILISLRSEGGAFNEAMKIAKLVREEKISTIVRRKNYCFSSCAFIFMSGSRQFFDEETHSDRFFEVGAQLGFHAPYDTSDRGVFEEGVRAARILRETTGERIPEKLFNEALKKGRNEKIKLESIYDAGIWEIELLGFREPLPSRESLLNACYNDASWMHKKPLGPLTGVEMKIEGPEEDWFLEDADGEPLLDQDELGIRAKNYQLPNENDASLIKERAIYNAPNLLKFIRFPDGSYAAQFAFDERDTPAGLWCTVIKDEYNGNVLIFDKKTNPIKAFHHTRRQFMTDNNWHIVPQWFLFAPGVKLSSITK